MILAGGQVYPSERQNEILERLEGWITPTLLRPPLQAETVIAACDRLAARLMAGEFDGMISRLGLDRLFQGEQVAAAVALMSRDSLEYKLATELGPD